jgi:hypothetical protein
MPVSVGQPWAKPLMVAVTLVTGPVTPDTGMLDGSGEDAAGTPFVDASVIVIALVFETVSALACPAASSSATSDRDAMPSMRAGHRVALRR